MPSTSHPAHPHCREALLQLLNLFGPPRQLPAAESPPRLLPAAAARAPCAGRRRHLSRSPLPHRRSGWHAVQPLQQGLLAVPQLPVGGRWRQLHRMSRHNELVWWRTWQRWVPALSAPQLTEGYTARIPAAAAG